MRESEPGRNERLVLKVLTTAGRAMSAYDVLDALRGSHIRAPAQVYRALDRLARAHLVHRIESMNAFVACVHDHGRGHNPGDTPFRPSHGTVAFCICEDCGDVRELPVPRGGGALGRIVDRTGFRASALTLEIRGHCKACSESP